MEDPKRSIRNRIFIRFFWLLLAFSFLLPSCVPEPDSGIENKFLEKGFQAYQNHNYEIALPYFIYLSKKKNDRLDVSRIAYFYTAMSYYHLREPKAALENYHAFLNFKGSSFSYLLQKLRPTNALDSIANLYIAQLKGEKEALSSLLDKILDKKNNLQLPQLHALDHILFSNGFCNRYREMDVHYKRLVAAGNSQKTNSVTPIFALNAMQCSIVRGVHGLSVSAMGRAAWRSQAVELLTFLEKQTITLQFDKLLKLYRYFLNQEDQKFLQNSAAYLKKELSSDVFDLVVRYYQQKRDFGGLRRFLATYKDSFRMRSYEDQYNLASYYSLSGQTQEALTSLDNALKLGYRNLAHMDYDPDLNNIRLTPGYKSILNKYFPRRNRKMDSNG